MKLTMSISLLTILYILLTACSGIFKSPIKDPKDSDSAILNADSLTVSILVQLNGFPDGIDSVQFSYTLDTLASDSGVVVSNAPGEEFVALVVQTDSGDIAFQYRCFRNELVVGQGSKSLSVISDTLVMSYPEIIKQRSNNMDTLPLSGESQHSSNSAGVETGTSGVSSSSEIFNALKGENSAPVIFGESLQQVVMSEDRNPVPFELYLIVIDSNETDVFTWSLVRQATHGIAVAEGANRGLIEVGYVPEGHYNGLDTFVVAVSDGTAEDTVTIEVVIEPVNDFPYYIGQATIVGINEVDNLLTLNSGGQCFDIEGDAVYHYRWYRDDDTTGRNGVLIAADSKTYRTQSEDLNYYIYGTVSCIDETLLSVISYSEYTSRIEADSFIPTIIGFTVDIDDSVSNGHLLGALQYTDPTGGGVTLSISGGNEKGIFGIDAESNIVVVDDTYLYFNETGSLVTLEVTVDNGVKSSIDTVHVTVNKMPMSKLVNDFNHTETWNNRRMVYAKVDEYNPEMLVEGWFLVQSEYMEEVIYLHKAVGVDSASLTFVMPDVKGMSRIIISNLGEGAVSNAWHLKLHNGLEWQEVEFGSKITSDFDVSVDFEDVIISLDDFTMKSADVDSLQIISRITSSTTLRIDSIWVDNN